MRAHCQRESTTRHRYFPPHPFVLVALLLLPAAQGQAADLFTAVAEPPPASITADELTVRSRLVTMDLGQVESAWTAADSLDPPAQPRGTSARSAKSRAAPTPGTTLTFNLFDDVVVTGRVEHTAPTFSGGYSVAGHLVEEPLGTMTLVVNGTTVAGTVRLPGEVYEIRSVGDGLYAVSEVEDPPFECEAEAFSSETEHQH